MIVKRDGFFIGLVSVVIEPVQAGHPAGFVGASYPLYNLSADRDRSETQLRVNSCCVFTEALVSTRSCLILSLYFEGRLVS